MCVFKLLIPQRMPMWISDLLARMEYFIMLVQRTEILIKLSRFRSEEITDWELKTILDRQLKFLDL